MGDIQNIQEEIFVIFHACSLGRSDVIKNAISQMKVKCPGFTDADIAAIVSTRRQEDDISPLHLAATHGHSDVIRSLLNVGADPSIHVRFGEFEGKKPYDIANEMSKQTFHVYFFEQVAMGKLPTISLLLRSGIPISIRDNSKANDTLLHWACSFNNIDVVKLLISYGGIDVNIINGMGQTSLFLACKNENIELIELLLLEGASADHVDLTGQTPLDSFNHHKIIEGNSHKNQIQQIIQLLKYAPEPTKELHHQYLDMIQRIRDEEDDEKDEIERRIRKIDKEDNDDQYSSAVNNDVENNGSEDDSSANSENGSDGDHHHHHHTDSYDSNNNNEQHHNHNNHNQSSSLNKDSPQLVLWPPTQNQSSQGRVIPLVLSSASNLIISFDSSSLSLENDNAIYSLLLCSGLLNILDKFGFQLQVKRSANWAKIKLCIDSNLCPGRHAFRMSIEPDYAILMASDSTGLLYAIYAFIQLLQLHSEVILRENVTTVYIPPVTLTDRPDISNRAVLWSYKSHARMQTAVMKQTIELLSKLRINMIFLSIDVYDDDAVDDDNRDDDNHHHHHNGDNHLNMNENKDINQSLPSSPFSKNLPGGNNSIFKTKQHQGAGLCEVSMSRIHSLDQLCRSYCIELIPTLTFTTYSQTCGLTVDLLKNFSHKMINLNLMFDSSTFDQFLQSSSSSSSSSSVNNESKNGSSTNHSAITLCQQTCEKILFILQQAGITSIHLCCNEWTKKSSSSYSIAIKLGFHVIEHMSMDQLFPPSLFLKPVLLSMGSYVRELIRTSHKIQQCNNTSIMILPAFMEADILYPTVSLKYVCFLFAGLVWNQKAVVDMLDVGAKTNSLTSSSSLVVVNTHDDIISSNNPPITSRTANGDGSSTTKGLIRLDKPNNKDDYNNNTTVKTTPRKRGIVTHKSLIANDDDDDDDVAAQDEYNVNHNTAANNITNNSSNDTTIYCASIFREVASLLLFNRRAAVEVTDSFAVLLNILTGEWVTLNSAMTTAISGSNSIDDVKLININNNNHHHHHHHHHQNEAQSLNSPRINKTNKTTATNTMNPSLADIQNNIAVTTIVPVHNLVKTEQSLWCILTATPTHSFIQSMAPSKIALAECLRYYRRLLSQANWKRSSNSSKKGFLESFTGTNMMMSPVRSNSSSSDPHWFAVTAAGDDSSSSSENEMDELFCMMNILSIVCRAAILSYIAYEKKSALATTSSTTNKNSTNKNSTTDNSTNTNTFHSRTIASTNTNAVPASPSSSSSSLNDNHTHRHNQNSHRHASLTHTTGTAETGVAVQLTWGELLQYLPPGSKSDIANQILESMNHLNFNLKHHKFDQLWFDHNSDSSSNNSRSSSSGNNNNNNLSSSNNSSNANGNGSNNEINGKDINSNRHNHHHHHHHHVAVSLIHHFKSHYLLREKPVIPLMAFFRCVSHTLPMPLSPDETLMRLFPTSPFLSNSVNSINVTK